MANRPALTYSIAGRPDRAREIILARLALGLSQRRLAQLAGVNLGALCHIETGRTTPTPATLAKIEAALAAAATKRATS